MTTPDSRPRMRGILHAWAAGVAVIVAGPLCYVAAGHTERALVGCVVYAITLVALFATSGLFHRVTWRAGAYLVMKRLDHAMIFVFIAGCYTAFAGVLLDIGLAERLLGVVWGGAAVGVAMKLVWPRAPRVLGLLPYLALGGVALWVLPELLAAGGPALVGLLAAGGVIYAVGGACWAARWPDPWPETFGHHEIFHAAVVVAAAVHHVALYVALGGAS